MQGFNNSLMQYSITLNHDKQVYRNFTQLEKEHAVRKMEEGLRKMLKDYGFTGKVAEMYGKHFRVVATF